MSSAQPIPYERFRTGLSYREVAAMVWSYSEDSRTWLPASEKSFKNEDGKTVYPRRRLILGKWFEIKQEMYRHYVNDFHRQSTADELDPVPF